MSELTKAQLVELAKIMLTDRARQNLLGEKIDQLKLENTYDNNRNSKED